MNEPMIRMDRSARCFAAAERRTTEKGAPAPSPAEKVPVRPLIAGG